MCSGILQYTLFCVISTIPLRVFVSVCFCADTLLNIVRYAHVRSITNIAILYTCISYHELTELYHFLHLDLMNCCFTR